MRRADYITACIATGTALAYNRDMAKTSRDYDVVLYGASGFVGAQTVAYFAQHAQGLRWALGGRNRLKLEAVRAQCGPGAAQAGIVVAAASDDAALHALAASTRIVASTAGPFALYGSGLVAACVANRTHYVDITGETPWVHSMIDAHHDQAAHDGTRIIPGCGFDSIPSDLGSFLVAQALWQRFGQPCTHVTSAFTLRGGLNGGTFASLMNMLDSGQQAQLNDLFLLNPPDTRPQDEYAHRDPVGPLHHPQLNTWLAPFVMGPVNSRVVRRSAALMQQSGQPFYAPEFVYQEHMQLGRLGRSPVGVLASAAVSVGMAAGLGALQFAPARKLAKRLAPQPGQGPAALRLDQGEFRCVLVGHTAQGDVLRGLLSDEGDPSNRCTTKMLCESALALALDANHLPGGPALGGVLTPSTGLGNALAVRLHNAGMRIEPPPPYSV
jgi:short subunit dehydrogenase-like uncharacterized protein